MFIDHYKKLYKSVLFHDSLSSFAKPPVCMVGSVPKSDISHDEQLCHYDCNIRNLIHEYIESLCRTKSSLCLNSINFEVNFSTIRAIDVVSLI